jgi:hypothetical protein
MSDSPELDALARRYLDLWEEQMAAWASDAALADILRLWLGLVGLDRYGAAARTGMKAGDGGDGAAEAGGQGGQVSVGSPADAAALGHRHNDMAELARRLAALEQRLAVMEARIPAANAGAGRGPQRHRAKGVRGRPRRPD